ncbi:MAG TPA: hypothetical protein GX505_02530 [Clostridiales bacterium]|nr:hypothetical protein [Clostridiales bacterium]
MEKFQFRINQKIEFINGNDYLGTSLVQDYREDYFLVSIPLKGYQKHLLQVGDVVTGIYYDTDGKLYRFESKVLERVVQNIAMFKLSIPEKLTKVQRRDYVRLLVTMPVQYLHITPETKLDFEDEDNTGVPVPLETGTLLDISGSGVHLATSKPLDVGESIFLAINTDDLQISVKGKVVRCYAEFLNNKNTYHNGIRFIKLSESKRDKIIGFIFKKFREGRQKGVLL